MSDVTNPGLVNVADQAFKPDLKVNSLAIPLDDDVLVPVADQDIDPVTGNPLSVTFPTPAEAIVAGQAPTMPSQDFSVTPGVAPLYLPFPPSKNDPDVQKQSITAGTIAEFTVGPDMSIQTNITPAIVEDYSVTSVLDADTLQPVVVPTPPQLGTFTSVQDTSLGIVTVITNAPLSLTSGLAVVLAKSLPPPGPYDGITTISNVISLSSVASSGIAVPNIATTGTTFGFPSTLDLPAGLSGSKWVTITGGTVPAYQGVHALSNVVNVSGNYASVAATDPASAQIIVVSQAALPTGPGGLANGQLVFLSG